MLQSTINIFTANVVSYDANTRIATLDQPVDISLGYNAKLGVITSNYTVVGNNLNVSSAIKKGNKPQTLSTDENGNFFGILNIPPASFNTGQRVFRVDNRTVSSDQTTSTTYAEATFTAAGLSTTGTQFSPAVDSSISKFTPSAKLSEQNVPSIAQTNYTRFDPIAQSFNVSKDNYPNGIFISSIKLFFASKPAINSPIKLTIVPTLNGYPNGASLDYSTVILDTSDVKISSTPHYLDSNTWTEFKFSAPVYISPGTPYAFLLQSSSSDYTLYLAEQNKTAIPSTGKAKPTDPTPSAPTKTGAAPYTGALFESQNGSTWTADLSKDLMFVIDQCIFDISEQPEINFILPRGMPKRKFIQNDIQYKLDPSLMPGLYTSAGGNQRSDAYNLTTTDFVPSQTNINYEYSSLLIRSNNETDGPYTVNPGKYGNPTPDNIYLNDGKGPRLLIKNTDTSFTLQAKMTSSDANVSPILSDDGITLYNIRYYINNMGITNPVISLVDGGSGYNANTISVTITPPDIGSDTATVAPLIGANGVIERVYVTYPGSGYLTTPTITISDPTTRNVNTSNAIVTVSGETDPSGGNASAKYFTKKVVLAPGQDSGDLRVFYTAYRPFGTNVFIYYKILSSNDTQKFEDGNWQLMTTVGNPNVYSTDRTNTIEFEAAPGLYGSNQANNSVSYVSTNGQTYNSFIQFAIKVVMSTDDTTKVPFLTDIRALALPSGTGF